MQLIQDIIQHAVQTGVSDIHLTEGKEPALRRNGALVPQSGVTVGKEDILSMLTDAQLTALDAGHDLDFALSEAGGRQRVNVYRERGRMVSAIRLLNDHIPTMEQLRLPPIMRQLAEEPRGLILVTGPTGSGKSTTLASMINHVANTRAAHIITIEDPIEYIYGDTRSLIHQREVGRDVTSFEAALRSAMREDPDVILVGEMRDFETISAAVTAAETGHLVLSTLHTTGAAKTVDRIIDVFPPHSQGQIRAQLGGVLKGVITQQLLPMAPDPHTGQVPGRIAATEVMLGSDAILNLIREGKVHQINSTIQSSAAAGMMTLDACMANYVRQGLITRETAQKYATNPAELRNYLGG